MDNHGWRGLTARVVCFLLALTLLAGCADGRSRDAERGRQADQERESIVTDLQATQTWLLIHGTPESTPEE